MKVAVILITVFSVQAMHTSGPVIVNDLVNCLSDMIKTNFLKPGLVIFPHPINASSTIIRVRTDILTRIHRSKKYTVQITAPDSKAVCNDPNKKFKVVHSDPFKVMSIASYFVIIVDSFDDFTHFARKIIRSRFWNPYGKFLILLHNITMNDDENREDVENILTCLFKYNVINVVVMVPRAKVVRNVIIYSWKPYDPPNYCGYFNESAKNRLLIENTCDRGILKSKGSIFKDKLPSNMQQCSLNILAIERQPFISRYKTDPNMEKRIIKQMLKPYNFSVGFEIILNKFRGERDEKGVWDGALQDLVAKRGQILLGGIFPDFDVHEDFDCSATYLADSYAWVVPRAYPSPPWSSLTAAFENEVWYLAAVIFVLCGFSWKILGQISGDSSYNRAFKHCFLNSWILLFGFPPYVRPKKGSLRIFFIFLNTYCILFMTAYQTKLIIILRNQTFRYQIKTIHDVVLSGLKIGGSEELHGLFQNSSDPIDNLIDDKWIDVHNITQALLDVAVYRNFSVLCSRLELEYLASVLPELHDVFGRTKLYTFEKSAFLVPLEMIGLRGFPFMKILSRRLNSYKQFGLNEYVRRYFTQLNKKNKEKLLVLLKSRPKNISALTIQHLQCGFLVLSLGMVGGTVVLMLEILLYTNLVQKIELQIQSIFKRR
ncbi:uncharacterized protein LOC112050619 [Bicyclus anynana]|uniref:Uncharacterized protein LOC112050619 n=1 Tax=Bicyclus anynana TaxID=110368 RepID=A0ABM3LNZ6_BICAN|nr:uncharacterized protein LOC112050619 [Bicyclus anynana]